MHSNVIEEADSDLEQSEVLNNTSKSSVMKTTDTERKKRVTSGFTKFSIVETDDRESSVKKR